MYMLLSVCLSLFFWRISERWEKIKRRKRRQEKREKKRQETTNREAGQACTVCLHLQKECTSVSLSYVSDWLSLFFNLVVSAHITVSHPLLFLHPPPHTFLAPHKVFLVSHNYVSCRSNSLTAFFILIFVCYICLGLFLSFFHFFSLMKRMLC